MKEIITPRIRLILALAGAGLFLWGLVAAQDVLVPFIIAFGLAYLFDPVIDRLEKKGMGRSSAIVLLLLLFFLGLGLFAAVVGPVAVAQVQQLAENAPHYVTAVKEMTRPFFEAIPEINATTVGERLEEGLGTLGDLPLKAAQNIMGALGAGLSSTLGFLVALVNLLVIPVATFYLLKDFDTIIADMASLVPPRFRDRLFDFVGKIDGVLSRFVRGQLIIAACMGFLLAAGLTLIGVPMGLLIGLVAGLANVIPYLATVVGLLPALLLAALQYGDWLHPGLVVALFVLAQGLEGFVIAPKVLEDAVGLHPVAIMAALLFGGSFFGVIGLLLAAPVAAVFKVALEEGLISYRASAFFGGAPAKKEEQPEED